ncbi:MAG: hypothetical protein EBW14_19700, partial [Oxalobacteraceae bacterium]|nr:hypothetical protein [Oxalobacteraceae bacterium]
SGPNEGKTPQYLSNYVYKTGLIYEWQSKVKASLLGNYVGHSYASDNNLTGPDSRLIPAYNVWDLTWEARLWNEYVSLVGELTIFSTSSTMPASAETELIRPCPATGMRG